MGADQGHREFVQAGVVANEEDAADGLLDVAKGCQQQGDGGEIEAVHRFDEGGLVPRFQRGKGFLSAAGGADEDEVGGEAEVGHGAADGRGRLLSAGVEGSGVVRKVAVVPR